MSPRGGSRDNAGRLPKEVPTKLISRRLPRHWADGLTPAIWHRCLAAIARILREHGVPAKMSDLDYTPKKDRTHGRD